MSIGNILIRPQVLDRRPLSTGGEVMDLLTALASRLVEDFLRGGPASVLISGACSESIKNFIPQFEPRLARVGVKLDLWLKAYVDLVKAAPTPDTTVAGLIATSDFGFTLLNKIIEDVHAEPLAERLNSLLDIVENDLGVTREGIEDLFLDMLDRIETQLSHDFLGGNQNEISVNNFLLSVQIRRIRREVRLLLDLFPLPNVNPRQMIREGQLRLEAAGWDEQLEDLKRTLSDIQTQITEGVPKLNELLKFDTAEGFLNRDIGTNPGQYAWYLSWFKSEPCVAVDRFSLEGSEKIKFEVFPQAFLEHWTHWTMFLQEGLTAFFHEKHIGTGNFWSPFLNIIGQGSMAGFSLLSLIDNQDVAALIKIKENSFFKKLLIGEGFTLAGSFEDRDDFWSWFLAFWQNDRAKANKPDKILGWGKAANDALLDVFTLINNDKDAQNVDNYKKIKGWTALVRKISAHFIGREMAKSDRYHAPFDNFGRTTVTYLLGGGLGVFGLNVVGWLLAGAMSRRLYEGYWVPESFEGFAEQLISGKSAYGALVHSFLDFNAAFDLEGDTDGGKFGLKTTTTAAGSIEYQSIELSGYAPRGTSPYLLPFQKEAGVMCSQSHRGRSSHNNHTGLIYAVDFVLQKGDMVLAMRGGTVVAYEDSYEKGTKRLNYIVIRHDKVNPLHDKTESGHITTTYARYENGQPFSIQRAFASMGIVPDAILGMAVAQGQPLMLLEERKGFLTFNYLQVHVWAAAQDGNILPTIPFVFKDVANKGVPKKGLFYGSQNSRKTINNLSLFHAPRAADVIEESGADYVVLAKNAEIDDNFYQNTHIFIYYTSPEGIIGFEYKKISRYEGSSRKAFITEGWLLGDPPPIGAEYIIGAKPYNESDALDKQFAFLADRDEAGNAKNLAIDTPPFKWLKIGRMHLPTASGTVLGGGAVGTLEVEVEGVIGLLLGTDRLQHIVILRDGKIIQYRQIQEVSADGFVTRITVNEAWDRRLINTVTPDTYIIGAVPYYKTTALKDFTFLAANQSEDTSETVPFSDNKPPYTFNT